MCMLSRNTVLCTLHIVNSLGVTRECDGRTDGHYCSNALRCVAPKNKQGAGRLKLSTPIHNSQPDSISCL